MNTLADRRFQHMLGLSVLLHGALFVALPRPSVTPPAMPQLVASIRLVMPEVSMPAPAPAPAPAAQPAPVQEALQAPAAAPRAAEATAAPPATPPHPTAQRASTEAIDSYRRQLTDLFAREHEYPRVAAMRGWEGEVRLRLRVARRGQLLGVRVDRSSGFEVLDQDALALLEGHGKLPPLPEALEVAEIEVVVPITYRLRKAT